MTISQFYHSYRDEASCAAHLKATREAQGICCKKCGSEDHLWLKRKQQWQCKTCKFRTTLKSGTLFESSNLGLHIWYQALYMVCNTKTAISACELQAKLGLKRYEPAWFMMHKIRKAMSRITEKDQINGEIGLDHSLLASVDEKSVIPSKNNGDRSTQTKKLMAFVMVESELDSTKKYKAKTGRIRLLATQMLADDFVWDLYDQDKNYDEKSRIKKILKTHEFDPQIVTTCKSLTVYPWVTTALSNMKRLINGVYHHVSVKHTQLYFDEFAFKFNNRNEINKWNIVLNSTLR